MQNNEMTITCITTMLIKQSYDAPEIAIIMMTITIVKQHQLLTSPVLVSVESKFCNITCNPAASNLFFINSLTFRLFVSSAGVFGMCPLVLSNSFRYVSYFALTLAGKVAPERFELIIWMNE